MSVLIVLLLGCRQQAEEKQSISEATLPVDQLSVALEEVLYGDILHQWYPVCVDSIHGGYYSNFSNDWTLEKDQPKMIVTQGRQLWTSSQAAMFVPADHRYKEAADHGLPWLEQVMWDSEYGGFYSLVDQEGNIIPDSDYGDEKRAYGQAFAIYGLAAYYKMTHRPEALALAKKAFQWMEDYSRDPEYGGYFDYLSRKGERYGTGYPAVSSIDRAALKDYNSSIHILEAFAELFQVWQDSLLEERLIEMLHIVRDTITQEPGYMHLYFHSDWQLLSYRDSLPEIRAANYQNDHVSPGHDAETAFLLIEAAEILDEFGSTKDNHYEETLPVAKKLLDHSLEYGWDTKTGGFIEQGYYEAEHSQMMIVDKRKNWWGQVEGLHSLLLFSNLYPENEVYRKAFLKQWEYISANLLDKTNRGWYSWGIDLVPEAKEGRKGNIWKGPYHTGRGIMRCLTLLEREHHTSL